MTNHLAPRIAEFYDRSTDLWLDVWGEHMHHGYYDPANPPASHTQAQVNLVNRVLAWGDVTDVRSAFDSGCGVGGSARHIAQRFPQAEVLGATLSPVQARRGNAYNERVGIADRVNIIAQDVMKVDRPGAFDLLWSLESAEHMPNKPELLDHFHRLLAPDGKLLMVTWCLRDTPPALTAREQRLHKRIQELYHLPPLPTIQTYANLAAKSGFQNIETDDWTNAVAPFWKAVIGTVFQWRSIVGLLKAGLPTLRGAWAMRYMTEGYRTGLLRFGLLKATRP